LLIREPKTYRPSQPIHDYRLSILPQGCLNYTVLYKLAYLGKNERTSITYIALLPLYRHVIVSSCAKYRQGPANGYATSPTIIFS